MASARRTAHNQESTAAAIYGVIVSAGVMAAAHVDTAIQVMVAVLVTLIIYWGAERYARVIAERIHEGHRPSWPKLRQQLTIGWEMVTASYTPLAVLGVLSLLGVDLFAAVVSALVCSTVLLGLAGWAMGRSGHLTVPERIVAAVVASMFGVVMIVLKSLLH